MTPERSRRLGMLLMAVSVLQTGLFALGMLRRSYAAVAIPVAVGIAVISGMAFWVGLTMATHQWDDADFGDEDPLGSPEHMGPI